VEQKALVEKLRKDAKRAKDRLAKIEEDSAKIKFPVKDEILMTMLSQFPSEPPAKSSSIDAVSQQQSTLAPIKPIPAAVLQLGSMLPDVLVNDALGVWDFLNVFR
jgi:hypothetical protein